MLEKNSPRPLYVQLEELLRAELTAGVYGSGGMIPSELELARRFGISRMTARGVVTRLVNEGLLYRVQGKGTFVVEPKIEARSLAYQGIREQLEGMGYSTTTKLMEFRIVPAEGQLTRILNVPAGERLLFAKRLRSVDNTPISLHLSYIPEVLAPTLQPTRLETEQLCVILAEDFNLVSVKVEETLESTRAHLDEAKMLGVERGFPLLLLTDSYRAASGQVFEHTNVLFRGDKVKLRFEYDATR